MNINMPQGRNLHFIHCVFQVKSFEIKEANLIVEMYFWVGGPWVISAVTQQSLFYLNYSMTLPTKDLKDGVESLLVKYRGFTILSKAQMRLIFKGNGV